MKDRMLFLAWAAPSHSGRSRLLADKMDIELLLVHYLRRGSRYAPVKYLLQAIKTLAELRRRRPQVVFVQDPPILASLIVWIYCRLANAHLIIDSHTDALLASWWQWSMPLHRFLSRRAICTIVTNDHLKDIVESWGAPAFVLADVPTRFRYRPYPLDGGFNVAMVGSFSYDEPRQCVFQAAEKLPDVQFYVTGSLDLSSASELASAPPNVHFTGFLPAEDYYGLLRSAHAVMVLTTEDHTLQWGACEAVSLGRPVITSDWPFLRSYFSKGTVYVDNSAEDIHRGIVEMRREWKQLSREVIELREEREREWDEKHAALMRMIGDARHR
jgi:glycosyltransferase involved in cell wall biosynthesis